MQHEGVGLLSNGDAEDLGRADPDLFDALLFSCAADRFDAGLETQLGERLALGAAPPLARAVISWEKQQQDQQEGLPDEPPDRPVHGGGLR